MSEDPTRGHGFDELARSLAEGSISRRRALKLFAGTAIAALIPSTRAMAITCPEGTVKICHVPQRADGTCRRGAAETRCVTPENLARHAAHPCDCCGGCGGTDQCRENVTRTCFPTTCSPTGLTANCGTCGTDGSCFCVKTAAGDIRCVENFGFVTNKSGSGTACTTDGDCNTGDTCFVDCNGVKGCAHPATCTH